MADSIILATAQAFDGIIWMQDAADFQKISTVRYFPKR
jgi:predicted nucleic acid-binding protein